MTKLTNIPYYYHDGGRTYAGYAKMKGDCVCRAIAIAENLPYDVVYRKLTELSFEYNKQMSKLYPTRWSLRSNPSTGIASTISRQYLESLGYIYVALPKKNKKHYHRMIDVEDMLIYGTHILAMRKHLATCHNGILFDSWDSRNVQLLGYYTKTPDYQLIKICKHKVLTYVKN